MLARLGSPAVTARDPHHGGACEWAYDGKRFFHKANGCKWVESKRCHLTKARVQTLADLIFQFEALPKEG